MRTTLRNATFAFIAGLICLSASIAQAGEEAANADAGKEEAAKEELQGFDKAWAYGTLFEDKDGVLRKLALSGRAQIDSAWVHPDAKDGAGNNLEDYEDTRWRRFRFGAYAELFDSWKVHLEANFDLNAGIRDWYTQLTDAYIQWAPSKALKFKLLKQSAGFTLDGQTSSKRLITLERNNLTNNLWFTAEYFTGFLVSGKIADDFSYKASIFSSGDDPEFDWYNASWFAFLQGGYKFNDDTSLHVDFVHQDEDPEANTRPFQQVVSLVPRWQNGSFGIWGDLAFGRGFDRQGQGDVWGFHIKPFYDIDEHIQLVVALTHVEGDGDNSVRMNRYDNRVANVDDKGDRVSDIYAGVNFFFYGHKFKWQTGVTYTKMEDSSVGGSNYRGWTLSTGFRVYW